MLWCWHLVWILVRTDHPYLGVGCHRTLGSHQIQDFCRRSEQLVSREPRRELVEALAHVLGAKASPEAALTITKHRPSCLSTD
jgi:hypothetical protein